MSARHEPGCQPGGDRTAAGRVVPASQAACPGGVLPTDERAVGHAQRDDGQRADTRPRALSDAEVRHALRPSASGGRGGTRPRPDAPARDAPGHGVGLCVGESARAEAYGIVTPEEQFLGRPPVAKRQTSAESRIFFCIGRPSEADIQARELTSFPGAGADDVWNGGTGTPWRCPLRLRPLMWCSASKGSNSSRTRWGFCGRCMACSSRGAASHIVFGGL